jgi:hypothetical protein
VVADLCRRGGSNVYLGLADPESRLTGGPASAPLLQELMERLALVEGQPGDPLPQLLQQALRQTEPGTEIVLVATRPIDVADPNRFGRLAADLARRSALRQIRTVDASSPELALHFRTERGEP